MPRICGNCHHLECETCRSEQLKGNIGYCCKCDKINSMKSDSCEWGRSIQGIRGLKKR